MPAPEIHCRRPSDASRPLPGRSARPYAISHFNGERLNRGFSLIGLRSRKVVHIAGRCLVLVGGTWGVMALLALAQGLMSTRIEARNFFADYAAYAQFLIAVPLFVIAERVVNRNTREAARDSRVRGREGSVRRARARA